MAYNTDNFNLQNWNLSIPIDSTGGTTGTAVTISPLTGYESTYFYDDPDGGMTFYTPVDGATTKSSYGTRSELRELNPDGTLARWTLAQGGTMTATLVVNALPTYDNGTPGKQIIGQIHGSSNELIRLYDDNGQIYFKNDKPGTAYTSQKFLLTDAAGNHPTVALGEKFSYEIDARASTLTVKVFAHGNTYSSVTSINPYWQTDTLYFKAGVYLGVTKTAGVSIPHGYGYGQDTFYGLDMSHIAGNGLGGIQAPLAQSDNFIGLENQAITGNVLANNGHGADSGPGGLLLNVAAATLTTAHGGAVNIHTDGAFSYNPATNFAGADSFTYTLKDGSGLTATGTVDITLNAPVITPTPPPAPLPAPSPTGPVITGTSGSDTLNADHTLGSTVYGLAGNDYISGHDGNDALYGGDGNDKLYGYWGNDALYGGNGNDLLNGGPGNDLLDGGPGADTLTGGTGKDVFVFKDIALNVHDIISDFNTADDRLDISALLGQAGTAHLETVSGKTGLYVDPDGAGAASSVLVLTFEGTSNVNSLTPLHDILV